MVRWGTDIVVHTIRGISERGVTKARFFFDCSSRFRGPHSESNGSFLKTGRTIGKLIFVLLLRSFGGASVPLHLQF